MKLPSLKISAKISFFDIFIFMLCFTLPAIQAHSTGSYDEIPAMHLVSPKRADLMAKYIYAKQREWKTSCRFGHDIYYHHLRVWNGFWEYSPPKQSFNDFLQAFDVLLDSVQQKGFDSDHPIPLGSNGVICNGSHRLTACLLYGKNIWAERIPYECAYDFPYFKDRGLASKYLDAMALQYCELKPDSYILIVFPSALGHSKKVETIIQTHAEIVYKKEITFTPLGGFNFILTAYENEPFVREGENSNYPSARYKAKLCFPDHLAPYNPARIYLLQSSCLASIKKCKAEIRAVFNLYNDSVHSTDTHEEAIVLARALFNQNSVHCLNHRKDAFFPQFTQYFEKYRKWLASTDKEHEWFAVDSGAVLAAYGLRDCQDLDFLHYENDSISTHLPGIDSHNSHLHYHGLTLDDILFDPDNYFYYKGVKFCSLSVLRLMKEKRGEAKDMHDLGLINQLN